MALNSFQLFLGQIQAAPEVLKIQVLHIVFDILMVHDRDFLGRDDSGVRNKCSCPMRLLIVIPYDRAIK